MAQVICPYCNSEARLVKGNMIYPYRTDLSYLNFWYCDNGHEPAYVGCHRISVRHGYTGEIITLSGKSLGFLQERLEAGYEILEIVPTEFTYSPTKIKTVDLKK